MKKRLQGLITGVLLFVCLTGCGNNSVDLEKVVLENYESLSFYELLTKYVEEQIEEEFEETAKTEYSIVYDEGWDASEELNANALNEGERAITYSVIIKSTDGNDVERINIKFFVILYEDEKLLVPKGLYLDEDGYIDEIYYKSDINDIFENIFDELI